MTRILERFRLAAARRRARRWRRRDEASIARFEAARDTWRAGR